MSQIANLELVICSVETQAKHPELFHYTNAAAFIVKSNTFWASHYRDLADQTEVSLMRSRLPPAIAPRFDEIVSAMKLTRIQRRLWKKSGAALGTARDFVNSLYGATFDNTSDVVTAMDAFMTSFSTHAADGDFEREHGVWSQWRDYAGPDGFCIVLETAALGRLLGEDMDSRYWAHLKLDPVRYGDTPIDELFPELVDASAETLRQLLNGAKSGEMAVQQFLVGTTLLKDANYRPEREVRIVGIPGTKRMSDQAARDHPDVFKVLPLPLVRTRPNTTRRYVTVFEGLQTRLPIKRVIAGPLAGQHGLDFGRSLVDVPVTLSHCKPT
jgi:hypothetical protein